MAITDILAQSGDEQDFVVEIPTGNGAFVPVDVLLSSNNDYYCSEIPLVTGGGGGNIFIMSE